MSWRTVVIYSRAKLDLQLGYMVVRGETVKKVHLSEISVVMIESTAVSLTAALLAELVRQKIKVIFCDEKRNPSSELVPYYGAHDTSSKIRQQINWNKDIKGLVWKEVVRNKILNQAKVVELFGKEEAYLLKNYMAELQFDDESNREGHAAKVYFNALFGKAFSRADDDNINAALNYGYTVLLSACNREVTANGYITQIGIHHCNVYNIFNLGSDMMEVFRPFVDFQVFLMWQAGNLETFTHKEKMDVLSVLNTETVMGKRVYTLNYSIKLYCKSVFNALNDREVSALIPCIFKDKGNEL